MSVCPGSRPAAVLRPAAATALTGMALAVCAPAAGLPGGPAGGSRGSAAVRSPETASPAPADTIAVTDDLGRRVALPGPARRIVSLVPAATEILFALGAGEAVVGRTRYGVHPPAARRVPSVGEGVRPSTELVVARDPDLVVLYAGEANRSSVRELERLDLRTLPLEHDTFDDLFRAIDRLGVVTGRRDRARRLVASIRCATSAVGSVTGSEDPRRVYYDVWGDPPVTIGSGSYLDSLVSLAGGTNVFGDLAAPSPRVSLEAIVARNPDVVVWPRTGSSASGTPPGERSGWSGVPAVARGDVLRVDGDLLHRLGPRIGDAARQLAAALHPHLADELRRAVGSCGSEEPEAEG